MVAATSAVDRKSPLRVIQSLCAAGTLLGLVSFGMSSHQGLSWTIRAIGAGCAIGYEVVDHKRKRIESGEEELDVIAVEWAKLEAAQTQFRANSKAEIERIQQMFTTKLQEIAGEWEEINAEKEAIAKEKAELEEAFALREQQWAEELEAEKQRLESIAHELNAKAMTQEVILRQEREEHQIELRQLRIELYDRERAVQLAEANVQLRMQELETEYSRKLTEAKVAIVANHEVLYKELQHEAEKISTERQVLEDSFNQQFLEIQAALEEAQNDIKVYQQRIEEEEQAHVNHIQKIYEEKQLELEQARQFAIEELEGEWAVRVNEAETFIDSLMGEIEGLRSQLQEFLVAQKFPDHKGYAAYVGNIVLDAIREFEGVLVEPHDCLVVPGGTEEHPNVVLWLVRGEGVRPETIFGLKAAIAAKVQRTDITMQLDASGFVAIGFGKVEGAIKAHESGGVDVEENGKTREAVTITEPSEQQLADAFDHSSMYFVCGPTGIGKSTLVNNLNSRAAASLGKDVEIIINDLKFPDPDTRWRILGKEIIPQYCDFENDECMQGCLDMAAHFLARKRKRLADAKAKRPITRFKKSLWVIDEAPTLIDAYKANVSAAIKMGVRVARGLDGKLCIIGQTPRCRDYMFKIPDMNNFTRFYLGADFATLGLKEINISPRIKTRLLAEIHLRQKLAEEQVARGELLPNGKPPAMYFALVATQSSQVFLMTMPPPNAYDNWEPAKEEEGVEVVPDSDIPPVSRDDLQRLMAKAMEEEGEAAQPSLPPQGIVNEPVNESEINYDAMTPLQQTIAQYALKRRGELLIFSDYNARSAPVREEVDRIALSLVASDNSKRRKTASQGGKLGLPKGVTKSGLIKEACYELVNTHKIGSISPDGKRFGIL